jgi:hypothetical protein
MICVRPSKCFQVKIWGPCFFISGANLAEFFFRGAGSRASFQKSSERMNTFDWSRGSLKMPRGYLRQLKQCEGLKGVWHSNRIGVLIHKKIQPFQINVSTQTAWTNAWWCDQWHPANFSSKTTLIDAHTRTQMCTYVHAMHMQQSISKYNDLGLGIYIYIPHIII